MSVFGEGRMWRERGRVSTLPHRRHRLSPELPLPVPNVADGYPSCVVVSLACHDQGPFMRQRFAALFSDASYWLFSSRHFKVVVAGNYRFGFDDTAFSREKRRRDAKACENHRGV